MKNTRPTAPGAEGNVCYRGGRGKMLAILCVASYKCALWLWVEFAYQCNVGVVSIHILLQLVTGKIRPRAHECFLHKSGLWYTISYYLEMISWRWNNSTSDSAPLSSTTASVPACLNNKGMLRKSFSSFLLQIVCIPWLPSNNITFVHNSEESGYLLVHKTGECPISNLRGKFN